MLGHGLRPGLHTDYHGLGLGLGPGTPARLVAGDTRVSEVQ